MHDTEPRKADNALARAFTLASLLRFAFPTMLMMVFNGLYTIVDVIFVARFVNADALSSVNIVTPAMGLLWGLGAMLGTGGSALIARKMGGNDNSGARRNFSLLVLISVLIGLALSGLGLFFLERIIRVLGANDLLAPYCRAYLGMLLIFAPACLLQVLFAEFFVTAGQAHAGHGPDHRRGPCQYASGLHLLGLPGHGRGRRGSGHGLGFLIPTLGGLLFFFYNKGPLRFTRSADAGAGIFRHVL